MREPGTAERVNNRLISSSTRTLVSSRRASCARARCALLAEIARIDPNFSQDDTTRRGSTSSGWYPLRVARGEGGPVEQRRWQHWYPLRAARGGGRLVAAAAKVEHVYVNGET
jgi:hypothetical protein